MWQTSASVWASLGQWLKDHESLAIWMEGIALVAIFIWDRFDASSQQQEMKAQIDIARQQAETATITARSIANSERAWLTADLQWETEGYVRTLDSVVGDQRIFQSCTDFILTVSNDGKTPAWIETVACGMEFSGGERQPERILTEYIPAVGAGKSREIRFRLCCPGKLHGTLSEQFVIHCTINYRDILEGHVMPLEFTLNPKTCQISRMEKVTVDFRSPSSPQL